MPKQQDSRDVRISVMDKGWRVQLIVGDVMVRECTRQTKKAVHEEVDEMLESVRQPAG